MAGIVELSTARAPVVADLGAYAAADISATYVEAEVQAVADQLETTSDKLRDLINALQSIGVIVAS